MWVPGDVAELYSDAFGHTPLFRKHASVLLLIVHQLTLNPGVAPVDLIQPSYLGQWTNTLSGGGYTDILSQH